MHAGVVAMVARKVVHLVVLLQTSNTTGKHKRLTGHIPKKKKKKADERAWRFLKKASKFGPGWETERKGIGAPSGLGNGTKSIGIGWETEVGQKSIACPRGGNGSFKKSIGGIGKKKKPSFYS